MIIRREAIAAALAATTKDETRFFLTAMQIRPDGTVAATNGHILIVATDTAPFPDAEFPMVAGAPFKSSPETPVLLPADKAARLLAAMPKRSAIPILSAVQLSVNGSPESVTFAATDLEMPSVVTVKDEGQTFPAIDKVIPDADQPHVSVTLAIPVLEALIKAAKSVLPTKAANGGMITLDVPTDKKSLDKGQVCSALTGHVEGTDVNLLAVVMPCRK